MECAFIFRIQDDGSICVSTVNELYFEGNQYFCIWFDQTMATNLFSSKKNKILG